MILRKKELKKKKRFKKSVACEKSSSLAICIQFKMAGKEHHSTKNRFEKKVIAKIFAALMKTTNLRSEAKPQES